MRQTISKAIILNLATEQDVRGC